MSAYPTAESQKTQERAWSAVLLLSAASGKVRARPRAPTTRASRRENQWEASRTDRAAAADWKREARSHTRATAFWLAEAWNGRWKII